MSAVSHAFKTSASRGVTLMDALVGSAIMIIVFVGIASAFRLAVDVVLNNKARTGAVALANDRMEYVHSVAYDSLGTVGGIPAGTLPQNETIVLNGITYTRHIFIEYEDDPKDGVGGSDANNVVEDYKSVKVDVSWLSRSGTRHVTLGARISPPGVEQNVPGGTLSIQAINAVGQPVAGASVSIVNPSTSVNINTFTDASGYATILGAPGAPGYAVTVTEPGYSTAKTYVATAQNTNPNPGNLTVTNYQTTSGTFAIDVLGTKVINTWTQVLSGAWNDPLTNASKVATSSNITVSGGTAQFTGSAPYPSWGEVQSVAIAPAFLATWKTLTTNDVPSASTTILYRIYDGSGQNLIPDAQVPGNAAGLGSGVINLTGISTSTYPSIRLDAVFTSIDSDFTPTMNPWSVAYTYGPQPLGTIAFTLKGVKTIGSGPSGTIYKYSANMSTGAGGTLTIPAMEWDSYTISVGAATGYDVASACNPQPEALTPGTTMITNLFLAAHTTNSLLVDVRSAIDASLVSGATVTLTGPSSSDVSTTDACGQVFFKSLSTSGSYSITVTAVGHAPYSANNINVSGTSLLSISLN